MNQSQYDEPVAQNQVRRLRRSTHGTVGGVASGLAAFLGTEALLFQIAFVLLSLFTGAGLLLYLAAWLLLPQEDDVDPRPLAINDNPFAVIGGIVLGILGLTAMGQGIVWGPNVFIPVAMILIGAWLLNQRAEAMSQPSGSAEAATTGPPPPSTPPPPTFPAPPAPTFPAPAFSAPQPSAASPSAAPPPVPPPMPTWRPSPGAEFGPKRFMGGMPPPGTHWARARLDEPDPRQQRGPTGPPVTSITMAVTAVVVGALLVIRNVGDAELSATVFVGAVLAVLGAGLVASSFLDRSLSLIFLSLLTVVALLVAPLVDTTIEGGVGTKRVTISGASGQGEPSYSLGAGELRIDLRDLDPNVDHEIDVSLGAGPALIIVADDMPVEVEATNRAGYLDILGVVDEGLFNDVNVVNQGRASEPSPGTLKLTIDVTFGYAEVIRRG